jgi:hypothetical protein
MLDSWTITDADKVWGFRVDVERDNNGGRPEKHADVYDAELMLKECGEESAQWARDAVQAWSDDLWQFAVITVTPVHKVTGAAFDGSACVLGRIDYGWLPGGADGKGTWTDDRAYVRVTWVNEMIETAREHVIEEAKKLA